MTPDPTALIEELHAETGQQVKRMGSIAAFLGDLHLDEALRLRSVQP